ncbi:hypothetical protein ACMB91_005869 [Escherichia coli]
MSINEKHNKTNEMLTSQEVITATQKALAELINARKKVLSEMDDDNGPLFLSARRCKWKTYSWRQQTTSSAHSMRKRSTSSANWQNSGHSPASFQREGQDDE